MAIDKNADFTPSIPDSDVVPTKLPYNTRGGFKFWAQKVIPLVYDDSLSYYEVLCKVVNYLNNVIQNVDNLNESVNSTNQSFETLKGYVNATKDTLINTYNELQDYVNTYFDNLDVQEEINAKLDAMADSGELTNLLAPFIPDLVTQWLNQHVTPTSPVIDDTLTISGAGADAKVTGDKITELKEDLTQSVDDLSNSIVNNRDLLTKGTAELIPIWEQGYLATSTGQEVQSQEGIRSKWLYIGDTDTITVNLLSRDLISEAKIYFYENIAENCSKVIAISGLTSTVYIDPSWKYARIHFAKWNSTISVSDAASIFGNAVIGYTAFKDNLIDTLARDTDAIINNRDLLTKGTAELIPIWEQGYLANSTGQEVQSQEGIRSKWLYIGDTDTITVNLLSRDLIGEAKIYFYENIGENRSYVIAISGLTSTVYIDPSWKYARIHFAKWNSTISVSDAASIFGNAVIGYTAFKDNLIDTLARDTDTIINNRDLLTKGNAELVPIWEQGYLANATGQEVQSQEGIRSKWLYIGDADAITVNLLSRDLIAEAKIFFYENIGADCSSVKYIYNLTATVTIDPAWKYARIHFAKWNSTINVPDATSIFGNATIEYTALNGEALGYSNSRIFSNESIWHKEIYPLYYDEASTYTAQVLGLIPIEKDTIYSLYVGRIVGPSSAVLRVYVKYVDDSVERYDVSENNRVRTFKTANKDISFTSIIAVAVNGTAPGEPGKALFIDGVLLIGELKLSQIYVDNQYFAIPAYYMNHLLAKEQTIRANEKTCSFNGDSFVFLTDTHYSYDYMVNRSYGSNSVNTNHSIQMIKHIMDNTATRMIVFGGDLLNLCEGIDEMVHSANSFFDLVGKYSYRLMCAVGNHEYYTDLHDQSLGRPTPNELYGALIKFNEGYIVSKGPMDSYCFDNTVQKIRYVVVSCGRDTENTVEQTKWVLNCFLETPAEYKIITIGHAFMLDNMTGFRDYYHKQIVAGLDAVKAGTSYKFEGTTYDYSTLSNVSVICIITGHTHIDGYLVSEGGVLCICTTCDCWSRAGEIVDGEVVASPRPTGGIEEQAFDVMQFDFDNELIHCTRIGAGSDRTFTYGTNPGPVTT